MSKKTVKKKDKLERDIANPWEQAISDAEALIEEGKKRIQRLRGAILTFRDLRDSGEPWPGTSESENELMGQDGLLGQSLKRVYLLTSVYLTTHRTSLVLSSE